MSAGKFIPIDGDNTHVLNTSSNFQVNIPNFDNSLVENLFSKSQKDLNDSLVDDDETQLTTEALPNQQSLNDSLNTEDATQLPIEDPALPVRTTDLLLPSSPPLSVAEQGQDSTHHSTPPSSASSGPQADAPSSTTDDLNGTEKVRPLFGKKKKSFIPPTTKSVSPRSKSDENSTESTTKLPLKESAASLGTKKTVVSLPKLIKPVLLETSNNESTSKGSDTQKELMISSNSSGAKEDKAKAGKKTSNGQDATKSTSNTTLDIQLSNPAEKENTHPGMEKKQASKKTNAAKSVNSGKAAAKEEHKRKHLEREKSKQKKEEAKRERERLKNEKRLEQEKRKAEREQKKIDKEMKRIEKLQAGIANKRTKPAPKESLPSDKAITILSKSFTYKENLPSKKFIIDKPDCDPAEERPNDAIADFSDRENHREISQGNSVRSEEQLIANDSLDEAQFSANTETPMDTKPNITDNCASAIKSKKRKLSEANQTETSPNRFNPALKGFKFPVSGNTEAKKGKKKPKLEAKVSRKSLKRDAPPSSNQCTPANYSGPVWVQCDDCEKWRKLTTITDPSAVSKHWTCLMNDDTEHAHCDTPEEVWSDIGDSQEFIESPFVPGSLVWAKMDSYPWWPAMVEEDPDEESYYEMGKWNNLIPARYHVVFLDTPVCRGWVHSNSIQAFADSADPNEESRIKIAKKYQRSLKMAIKQASNALKASLKDRLEHLSFSQRFGKGMRKRKASLIDDDSMETFRQTIRPQKRNGVRQTLSSDQQPPNDVPQTEEKEVSSKNQELVSGTSKELESNEPSSTSAQQYMPEE